MEHRLFYTDSEVSESEYKAEKSLLIPFVYADLDDALGRAKQIAKVGGVPWEIDSGSRTLGRAEIAHLIRTRNLDGRPRLY